MKKEERDLLKQFRYFRILEDCGYVIFNNTGVELKKGDIIKIWNNKLEDYVFDKSGGLLNSLGYRFFGHGINEGIPGIFNIVQYPEDKPLDIGEYLRMQPSFKLPKTTEVHVNIDSKKAAYLSPEILDKFLNDSQNSVMLINKQYMNVSEYNKKELLNFEGKLNYHSIGLKLLGSASAQNHNSKSEIQNTNEKNLPRMLEKIKPGCYTADSLLTFAFFIKSNEEIDLSKPEYAFLAVNQDFMRALASSEEITNINQKKRIYEREQKDFLPNTNYRYYRLKDDVNVKNTTQLHDSYGYLLDPNETKKIGHNYNPYRVHGNISVVEEDSERISLIKVKYTDPTIYDIVDRELKKISHRLPKREVTAINLLEVSKKQRLQEEENAKKAAAKGKDYFRIKMMADLAATYIKDQTITDEFKEKAFNYYLKNEKLYWNTYRMLGSCDDDNFSYDVFYMMHLIRSENKDNRLIDSSYQNKLQEKRNAFTSALGNILKNTDSGR